MATPISLEFFPPKTPEGEQKLRAARRQLAALAPEYCSVTFGAGGSTQEGTLAAVREMVAEGLTVAPHLSCIGQTPESVRALLAAYRQAGVRRLVALRGDLPSGHGLEDRAFRYASDLVAFIRAETGSHFRIEVAAYPETHPQARSPQDDLLAFKAKIDAGADGGITQYFYNADAYFRYMDEARALGITVPVAPGIMPITNGSQLLRFSEVCGAEIPRWIRLRLLAYGEDTASIKDFGADVVAALCQRLLAGGAPALHIYTMNLTEPAQTLCQRLR